MMHVTMYLRRAKKKKEMKVRGKCASGQQRVGAEPKESTRGLVCLLEWSVEGLQLLQAGVNDRVDPRVDLLLVVPVKRYAYNIFLKEREGGVRGGGGAEKRGLRESLETGSGCLD